MRTFVTLVVASLIVAVPAMAELQNVMVGGEVSVRGNWYSTETGTWFDKGNSISYVEQRTVVNVKADFTDDVSAFIELESYDFWGEDFRSDYITGVDFVTATNDDVEVYQAYIQASDMFGYPVCVKIGRQEIELGSGWLVGNSMPFWKSGVSFDGIRASYAVDTFSVDAFWAKLAETSPAEEDGDVDLYGVYGSYVGIEDMTLDAYWLLVRDGRAVPNATNAFLLKFVEDFFGVDEFDPTYLHTVGLRGAGVYGAFDYEAEVAFQFGDADVYTRAFAPFGTYMDNDGEFDEFAANLEIGYTFDMAYQPRVFLGGTYFGGEDNRDLTFLEWVASAINPVYETETSISFNRLFSDVSYSEFIDDNRLSNAWTARLGVSAMPTEKIEVLGILSYFDTLEEATRPRLLGLPFWQLESDSDLGWEAALYATYAYSDDLSVEVGYSHFFAGDGLDFGNFTYGNGLWFEGAFRAWDDSDDADYVYFATSVTF